MPQDGEQRAAEPRHVTGCFPAGGGRSHRGPEVGAPLRSCDTVTRRIHFPPQLSTNPSTLDLATPRTHLRPSTRIHMDALAGPFSSPVHPASKFKESREFVRGFFCYRGSVHPLDLVAGCDQAWRNRRLPATKPWR